MDISSHSTQQFPPVAQAETQLLATLPRSISKQKRARNVRRDVLYILAWLSNAVVISFWLAVRGWESFNTLSGALTQIGVLSGLLGTNAYIIMLLLAARVPFIDCTIGHDHALAVHSKMGAYTVIALLIHWMALTISWSLTAETDIWTIVVDCFGMDSLRLAIIATLLSCFVALVSIKQIRTKMVYEHWYLIHLIIYIAAIISLPHQLEMGIFAQSKLARIYWIALWVFTGYCLLAYRIFLPIIESLIQQMEVTRVYPAGEDAVNIELKSRNIAALKAKGGQYFIWRFWDKHNWWHPHPISLSACPDNNTLRITVRNLGAGTASLQKVKLGTKVSFAGPYGIFANDARNTNMGATFIGAGIGIAPIRALIEESAAYPGKSTVIVRASNPQELYLLNEIKQICDAYKMHLMLAVGPRNKSGSTWLPETWGNTTLASISPNITSSDLFICGPTSWMQAVVADAKALGIPKEQIHLERMY